VNTKDAAGFFERIEEELERWGIQLESLSCDDLTPDCMKIVCMPAGLRESLNEMGKRPRGNVVMVRVDDPTITKLDNWVETGAVKTRSEAAALFIREGLTVRASELEQLRDAIRGVADAKDRLLARAKEVLGGGSEEPPSE
jgi:hypothetical protein